MKHVKKSVLLWYSAAEMYRLVIDVDRYPEFLPWCSHTEVLERGPTSMTARIGISFAGVRQSFTTRNEHEPDRRVLVQLVDGPFSRLEGAWVFKPLGQGAEGGAEERSACRIEFELSYAFSSRPLEMVVSPVFDRIANTFVDSFVKRAESVYGPR